MPNILKDLTGQRFGTLEVLSRAEGTHEAKWFCRCDCGHERVYVSGKLRRGDARCKCNKGKDKDGLAKAEPVLHSVWRNIKDRCNRSSNKSYPRYGGRGITVCAEWSLSFTAFCRWAKDNGWQHGLEIDRIDNNGGYEPSNCRFVTKVVNCRNKENNRIIEFRGESKILAEWAEQINVPAGMLHQRINRRGWSIERALTTPYRTVADAARARYKEKETVCHS